MSNEETVKEISKEMERLGRRAYEIAKESVMKEKFEYEPLQEAISYFMQEWRNFQHPALLAIACEAVGGNPNKTASIGAALMLLTGAADIHDDIIDKSKTKGSKATLFGKFGEDISLLVGDALLFKGLTLLNMACKEIQKEQGEIVQELVKQGFFELGIAEAKEANFKGRWNLIPEEYLDIIRRKTAVAEATARIGAVIGGANSEDVENWGKIGKTLGMVMNIRDEFVDIFEAEELRNRRDNGCLPLPMLYAMRNPKVKKTIFRLLNKKKELTDDDVMKIAEIILETNDVQKLKDEMQRLMEAGFNLTNKYKKCRHVTILRKLLRLALNGI